MPETSSIRPSFNPWEPSPDCFLDSPAIHLLSLILPRIQTTIGSCPQSHRCLVWFLLPQALLTESGQKDLSKSEQVSGKHSSSPQKYLTLPTTNPSSPCILPHCPSPIANFVCQPNILDKHSFECFHEGKTVDEISIETDGFWVKHYLPWLGGPLPKDWRNH